MSDLIPEGVYTGKIKDYGISVTKAGDPQVLVAFTFEVNESQKSLTWFGSLKEGKAQEITLDTLKRLGFVGADLEALTDGAESGRLNQEKEFDLVVGHHEYDGKTYTKINWVNDVGGGSFVNKLDKAQAVEKLRGLNLKGKLVKNYAPGANSKPKSKPPEINYDEELPF